MRKGHQDFVTVVSDIERGELLEVMDTHKQEEIIESLKQQRLEVRLSVEEVSVDMWSGFPKVIAQVFPNVVVVFDQFHGMKLVNEELNLLRKKVGVTTKGSKYLRLLNQAELTDEEKVKLEQVLQMSACLRIAYELKEEFRQIYETSRGVKSGQRRLQMWLNQAQLLYQDATQTIRNHLTGRAQLLYQSLNQWCDGGN